MAKAVAGPKSRTKTTRVMVAFITAPSVLVPGVFRLRGVRLTLIAAGRRPGQHVGRRGWTGSRHRRAVAAVSLRRGLVEVGVQLVGAVGAVEIDRQNLEDGGAL